MNTWTITWMSIRFDSIDDALVTGESSSTGLYNRPRPLGPRPIQRWSNTYAAGGPANHKMWGSRELSAYPDRRIAGEMNELRGEMKAMAAELRGEISAAVNKMLLAQVAIAGLLFAAIKIFG